MFSYRHAYHAGNHADLLKHLCLVAILEYLQQKETGLTLIDSHAGTGLYHLHGFESQASGEASVGIQALQAAMSSKLSATLPTPLPAALERYLALVAQFGQNYPGSPLLMQALMRPQDQLKAFELFAPDARALNRHLHTQYTSAAQAKTVQVFDEDGFTHLKRFLPPASRRALVFIDPSYELKSDYQRVENCVAEALTRFVTGCYLIWYPVIPRNEAHSLPKRLKTLSKQKQRPWLQVSLRLELESAKLDAHNFAKPGFSARGKDAKHKKLSASGILVINPPHTLKEQLLSSLPILTQCLQYGKTHSASFGIGSDSD